VSHKTHLGHCTHPHGTAHYVLEFVHAVVVDLGMPRGICSTVRREQVCREADVREI